MPQALAEKLAVEGLPAEVVDAVRISCGFSEKERDVAERVARCIPEFEQDALVKWVEEQQPLAASALAEGKAYALPSKRRLDVCIRLKRAWGSLFAQWCKERGIRISDRLPYGTIAKFRSDQGGAGGGVTNKQLVTFARAHGRHNFSTAALTSVATGGERGRRRCGGAGRPYKAPGLRDTLFEWFCSIRGAVKTRLPLSCLTAQAKAMSEEYMRAALKRQAKVQVPEITGVWVAGWRRQYQVSLRTPNRRWKVSRPVCLERCRITWLNLYRVRRL